MKKDENMNSRIEVVARFHNMTYPKTHHEAGKFAIVRFDVVKVISGEIPNSMRTYGEFPYMIVVKGEMPELDKKSDYVVTAQLIKNSQYGLQYEVESVRLDYNMTDPEDQKKFFSFFMTERQIDLLFSQYQNPVSLLEAKDIPSLTKIKGIGPATASRMCLRYADSKDNGRAYVALKEYGLTKNAIDKIVAHYKSADVAVEKVQANPYILIREVRGYGWKKCDEIAKRQGFTNDCKERVMAYTQYYLDQQAEANGNSWVTLNELFDAVVAECHPITYETTSTWLRETTIGPEEFGFYFSSKMTGGETKSLDDMPLLYFDPDGKRIGLLSIRLIEKEIAWHLERLKNAPISSPFDTEKCNSIISKLEDKQGFRYTEEQRKAIDMILSNNVSILTGGAGSGKTSTLAAVTEVLNYYNKKIELCALSGRASSKLSEVTGAQGKTIHRLLSYIPDTDSFAHNAKNPIKADVVILDETSMVGGEIFLCLVRAIRSGCKFIMVGDHHQLEAIGLANILKDCLTSGYIPSTVLTKIHRQAAASGIITQSLKVSNSEALVRNDFSGEEVRGELQDFKIVGRIDSALIQPTILDEFKKLYFEKHVPIDDIQVIVPMRSRGMISCRALNNAIQKIVNPAMSFKQVYVSFNDNGMEYQVCFKPNDRIIVTKNNYHAIKPDGEECQIFNGNVGYIKNISSDSMIINLKGQGDIIIDKEDWNNINLAYAITVHKKQGDQIPYEIFGFDKSCYVLYSRELLYTAITRASKYCVVVTQPQAINAAAKISRVGSKRTWLKIDLSKDYIAEQQKMGTQEEQR